MFPHIAFAGYARAGKDTACDLLVNEFGYTKTAFGSVMKRQIDPFVRQFLGFSAFTEVDAEKKKIRALLECWGDTFYEAITKEFFDTLPDKAANARIVREPEAREWVKRGGIIVEIQRPGYGPSTDWERDRLEELRATGLISCEISASYKWDLQHLVRQMVIDWNLGSPMPRYER